MRTGGPRLVIGILLATLIPTLGFAQEVRVDALLLWPDHQLLGTPAGVGVSAATQQLYRVRFRLGYEHYWDRFGSFGSTCVGLIPPEMVPDCQGERRREAS